MKNTLISIRDKMIQRYTSDEGSNYTKKSTNINVLLNRVRLDQKKESRKKLLFTAATSLGVVIFGVLIF